MASYSQLFLEKTINAWQPYSKEPLTLDDAREIVHNTVGLFTLLMKWEKEAQAKRTVTKEQK